MVNNAVLKSAARGTAGRGRFRGHCPMLP